MSRAEFDDTISERIHDAAGGVEIANRSKEADNQLRWDGAERGFYEVYYLKWNDRASNTAAWVRYTLTSPLRGLAEPYCELWGIFFDAAEPKNHFAVKNRFAISKLSCGASPFELRIGDAQLRHDACRAKVVDAGSGRSLSWDVRFDSEDPTHRYFPSAWLYQHRFPKTKLLSPHCNARFSGVVETGDRRIEFANAPGQQTHIWGTKHAHRWVWGHCNAFEEDPGAVWEGLTAQLKLGPVASPRLSLFYLKAGGEVHHFNDLPRWLSNKGQWELGKWRFRFGNESIRVEGEIDAPYDSLVGVRYLDPDGDPLWCSNSKVAPIRLALHDAAGHRIGQLTSANTCAVEFVDRRIYEQVPVRV